MDKAKILRLCNQIEMIIVTVCNTGYTLQPGDEEAIFNRTKEIAAEITAPPKSNADRIRQMTDEELADFLEKNCSCPNCCIYHPASCKHIRLQCTEGYNKWLKQEAREDAGSD